MFEQKILDTLVFGLLVDLADAPQTAQRTECHDCQRLSHAVIVAVVFLGGL